MVATYTIEGTINSSLWFHYDMENDVLYLRLQHAREAEAYADEQDDGTLLLRRQDDDAVAGLTVINWWKRFGQGSAPDSLRHLESALEPWAGRLAA